MKEMIKSFNERYMSKDEIRYRIPGTNTIDEIWSTIMEERRRTGIEIPLRDQDNKYFWFNLTEVIKKNILSMESSARDDLFKSVPESIEISVIADALIDEAFNSSVIEGAFSTKRKTKEMIENNLKPSNKSEVMILNNYFALRYILDNLDTPLNEDIILSVYRILTKDTLDEDDIVEKYRTGTVYVWDTKLNQTTYTAPDHSKVQKLMNELLDFINNENRFDPIIKACVIHFYFVYIHPFFDGNGRTARAISYMYLLQNGYDFFKFFSISSVINEEKRRYYTAIENTEKYGSDMTYFIDYYSSMMVRSITRIRAYFRKEFGKKLVKDLLEKKGIILSTRQIKLINKFIMDEKNIITIDEYRKKYKVSYETARTDLNDLEVLGFFTKIKMSKKYIYRFNDINDIVKNINDRFGTF